jgi:hypothetical protein
VKSINYEAPHYEISPSIFYFLSLSFGIGKPEMNRKKGRPRVRRMDGVEKDLRNLGVVNWRAKEQEWDCWRKFLEQAKPHKVL